MMLAIDPKQYLLLKIGICIISLETKPYSFNKCLFWENMDVCEEK